MQFRCFKEQVIDKLLREDAHAPPIFPAVFPKKGKLALVSNNTGKSTKIIQEYYYWRSRLGVILTLAFQIRSPAMYLFLQPKLTMIFTGHVKYASGCVCLSSPKWLPRICSNDSNSRYDYIFFVMNHFSPTHFCL